eukprot:m.310771 g.310771  ORF g.310771 m.310771 type:complete len:140 (-) comp27439_c1_seq4:3960-4379(-)
MVNLWCELQLGAWCGRKYYRLGQPATASLLVCVSVRGRDSSVSHPFYTKVVRMASSVVVSASAAAAARAPRRQRGATRATATTATMTPAARQATPTIVLDAVAGDAASIALAADRRARLSCGPQAGASSRKVSAQHRTP